MPTRIAIVAAGPIANLLLCVACLAVFVGTLYPLLTEAMTRAYVFADASAAGEVDHVEKIIDSMFARAMSDGEPTEDQYHIARVISDVWLSNLLAWLTRRASATRP